MLVLPLVLPPTVLGYYLLQILGRRAWLGLWLEQTLGVILVFHWSGAVVASAVAAFPLFLLPARGAIEGVDPALEDVARLLGRRESSVFLAVTLPLAWRGMAAGAVLAFVRALGDFGATMMVAGNIPGRTQTAALAIYDAVEVNDAGPRGLAVALRSRWSRSSRSGSSSGRSPREGSDVDRGRRPRPGRPAGRAGSTRARRSTSRSTLGRECGVVFGRSGAGKTTLLRLIAGPGDARPRATSGSVATTLFDSEARVNRPLRRAPDRR